MRRFFGFLCLFLSLFLFCLPFLGSCSRRASAETIVGTYHDTTVSVLDTDLMPFTAFRENGRSAVSGFAAMTLGYRSNYVPDSSGISYSLQFASKRFDMDGNIITFDSSGLNEYAYIDNVITADPVNRQSEYYSWTNYFDFYPYFQAGSNSPLSGVQSRCFYGWFCSCDFTDISAGGYFVPTDWCIKKYGFVPVGEFLDDFGFDSYGTSGDIYSAYISDDSVGFYMVEYVFDLANPVNEIFGSDVMPSDYFIIWYAVPCLIEFTTEYGQNYQSIPSQLAGHIGGVYFIGPSQSTSFVTVLSEDYSARRSSEADRLAYIRGYDNGLNTTWADVTPFDTVVYGVNAFLNLELFPSVKIGWILSFGFGLILLGLAISLFKHG